MDHRATSALTITNKNNKVVETLLACFKEHTKTCVRDSKFVYVPEVPMPPAQRCRMRRGGGRCRGVVSELATTQLCAYHQVRGTGDLKMNETRCMSAEKAKVVPLRRVFINIMSWWVGHLSLATLLQHS